MMTDQEFICLVEEEGELDGPMPDLLKQVALDDIEEFARNVVRVTKESILRRMYELSLTPTEVH